MAKVLAAPTEDFIKRERTTLADDASAGTNVTLTVENTDGLFANDFLDVGYEGGEGAELVQISSVPSSTTVVVGTLLLSHKKAEPVIKYRFDQRKFYGATSKSGTYTELTSDGSPKTIQVDDPQGTLLEYTGTTYSFFKATYYNSYTFDETDVDEATGTEADESKRYTSIYSIRKQVGFIDNPYYTDGQIEIKRKQAESEINSAIFARYVLPLSEIPALIQNICTKLAAGYIGYEEYDDTTDSKKWLGEARALLKAIVDGKQRLLDSDYNELERHIKVGTLQGYPDDTITEGSADDRKFRNSDRY